MNRTAPAYTRAQGLRSGGMAAARKARSKASTLLLAMCAIGPALAVAASHGRVTTSPEARVALVGLLMLIVFGATIATVMHVRRRPDTRSALMAVAFVGMSVVLLARVIAMVPGPLESTGIARMAEMATLPLGALILALSGTPSLHKRERVETVAQSAQALGIFLLVVLLLVFSARSDIPALPRPGSDLALLMFAITSALLVVLARRAARTAALSERPSDVLVTLGAMASICAYWGLANSYRGDVLWWTAHVLELIGITALCVPATRDLWRGTASRPLVGDLSAADIVADEEAFLDGRVHHLMLQLARKDDVTEGHTRRVAMLAVKMGERLGLDPASLRDLAAGGLLHDIGKLHTPDGILKKPGKLTDAEYEVIKRHPADGQRMLREVGRFNERVLHLVEAHHERLDGRGYPFGADAERIALEARILSVADVYDALTSHRPYRPAWPPDRALEVIERETGDAFDAECVAALRSIVAPGRYVPKALRAQVTRAKQRRLA